MGSFITKKEYHVIGVMSGTSLDGLDIALCKFSLKHEKWHYTILKATTCPYEKSWKKKLSNAPGMRADELIALHHHYGTFIGDRIHTFLQDVDTSPDLIASHGHTVFHRPDNGFTFQLGYGGNIYGKTNIITVADFRMADVIHGGQGAPLVPVGDKLLFGKYDYCLNLGGFSNVSFTRNNQRIAFDISPCNMALNYLASKQGLDMDKDGSLARSAEKNPSLFDALNALPFYTEPAPKSLGREWFENTFLPVLESAKPDKNVVLRTVTEHIAHQISKILKKGKTLVTGGGTKNTFLVELLKKYAHSEIIIPESILVDYKEALIFALLGVLRVRREINIYSSVTGASKDLCTGIIFDS